EEDQHAVELFLADQRDQGEAAASLDAGQQQLVVGDPERPEPGALEVGDLRRGGGQRVDEVDALELLDEEPVAGEQVPDVVLRVMEEKGHGIELIRLAQAMDQTLQQL